MRTLTLTNQKGGVGKSAAATMLAHYLRSLGHRVLCLDFDHQGNFTEPLTKSGKCMVSSVTADKLMTDPEATVEDAPMVLVPQDKLPLQALERSPDRYNEFAKNLRGFLARHGDRFDFAIIDTNPAPDIRMLAALVASDFALAPITLTQEAIDGLADLYNHPRVGIFMLQQRGYNRRLRFLGMLPMLVKKTTFQLSVLELLMSTPAYRQHLLTMVDDPKTGNDFARIREADVIREYQAAGQFLGSGRKTAAREAWSEVKPVLHRIATLMGAA
ncbi:ParA family protein [Azohydromonas australica]|uniref:ParA family protein n=1 Tax=Azohydromonas australica TaxID=364039 RepID=UPI00048C9826|nr:ParA family protein [Azohydromonas australica]